MPIPGREPATGHAIDRYHQLNEDELSRLAMEAAPAELELVLHHPRLTEQHVLFALRNPSVTPRLLERIGMDRRWVKSYDVKHHLVQHPRCPRHVALRYVKFLYLAHLLRLLDDHKVVPGLKRHAEALLRDRLPQITLGERLSMAKSGGRGVIRVVRMDTDPRVLRELLQNPRLTTADVVGLVELARTPSAVLQALAVHRRWSAEYGVKLALARGAHVPVGLALGSLSSLLRRDLVELTRAPSSRPVVKAAAARVLEARAAAGRPAGPEPGAPVEPPGLPPS
jgi:hypothetical protein